MRKVQAFQSLHVAKVETEQWVRLRKHDSHMPDKQQIPR